MKLNEAYDPQNIFAKILRGDLPSIKVYETADVLAFMDIMPQAPGHVLVIPKAEATNLLTLPEGMCDGVMRATQKVARAVQRAMDAPGFMIAQLNGSAAGQTVPHFHFHILPRENGIELTLHARDVADMDELEAIASKIRAALD